ncbi:microcephalin [Nerophis lumbriciformis]|uniref:microcephalin n=1 Tax=Nerophis lumbriciformis TaxID=546530 RepID=UPI002ADFAA04|nr:microcephalin [Nerophis lumbriciformis]
MTTSNTTVLKDVVAYVDVWSSDKRANYSKPFIQQLLEMGAQVSKTFNKQVTHVVFHNGHPATWRKAKKSHVKLVSVLWIDRCHEEGVHGDEELYPASNDESNPVLRNKKHRCMQPRDCPQRTPENDRRMKKKLDKLMKDMAPKQPMFIDVSPIFIDEDSGIVYSPSCKRADYMAERLKDMKEKHANISPTASQLIESSSPSGPKPLLGNSPTVFKFLYDNPDDDSSASVAALGHSADKENACKESDTTEHTQHDKYLTKEFEKSWLSPCPLKCPDFETSEEEGTIQTKPIRSSIGKKTTEKAKSVGVIQSDVKEVTSADGKGTGKEKRKSRTESCSPVGKPLEQSADKSEKGRRSIQATKTMVGTKTSNSPGAVNSSGCLLAPTISGPDYSPFQKKRTRRKPSLSALAHLFSQSSDSQNVASISNDVGDDMFEDFFSMPNDHKIPKKPLLPGLHEMRDLHIPFRMDSVPKKRKQRRSDNAETATNNSKKKRVEKSGDKCSRQQSVAKTEHESPPQQNVKESLPALDPPNATLTLIAKSKRQSTLPFVKSSGSAAKPVSASVRSPKPTNGATSLELRNHTVCHLSHTFQSKGSEQKSAAALTELPIEGRENQNKHTDTSEKINKAKSFRTLVMTSMPTDKQQTVVEVVKTLGGFSITNRVCQSTTHVVSGEHRRTINVLLGIARGCWIISFEWILWSLEQRQWLPEEPFELSEQFPAAPICRLQRHLSTGRYQQDLFQDQPTMFVSQRSQPPATSLVELIQLCGGKVCKVLRQAGICIGKYSGRRPGGTRILSEQWVLDSITHLKQLSYDSYNLE